MRVGMSVAVLMRVIVSVPVRVFVTAGQGGGRGQDESAGLDPLGADQRVGQLADRPRRASEQNDLEAAIRIEMNMSRRDNPFDALMLDLGQTLGNTAGVVVINQRDNAHCGAVVMGDRFLDQGIAHQAADGLAPVRMPVRLAIAVEPPEQLAADGDTEADEGLFHGAFPGGAPVRPSRIVAARADWISASATRPPARSAAA